MCEVRHHSEDGLPLAVRPRREATRRWAEIMSHDVHQGIRRVLGDDCGECVARANSGLRGLANLDDNNLRRLAELAEDEKGHPNWQQPMELGASYADMRAVDTLRLAARLVFRSRITEEVAS